jgi:hypothetical protein
MNIGETLIPFALIFGVVHVKYMHDHSVEDLCLASVLGWKVVDLVSLVYNSDQRLNQNMLRNLLSVMTQGGHISG